MKRLITIVLAAVLITSLAACGGGWKDYRPSAGSSNVTPSGTPGEIEAAPSTNAPGTAAPDSGAASTGLPPVPETPKEPEADSIEKLKEKLAEASEIAKIPSVYKDILDNVYRDHSFGELSSDGLSLTVIGSGMVSDLVISEALDRVKEINNLLGFPDSVMTKISGTSASDGYQTQNISDFTLTWWVSTGRVGSTNYKEFTALYEINR